MVFEKNVEKFNKDIYNQKGYLYSKTDKLSSKLANKRITDAVNQLIVLNGKSVLDIGCGDGTYTIELIKMQPSYIMGIDAADAAIDVAKKKVSSKENIKFKEANIYELDSNKERYDVAISRGILHHLYDVQTAIAVISKIAREIVVVEPNGYNPVLKIIEKTSRYHIEHEENHTGQES